MIHVTLTALLDKFRKEIGASTMPGQGVSAMPKWINLLQRTQEWFYDDYDWPHLEIDDDYSIILGERYYNFIQGGINPFRVKLAGVYWNTRWTDVKYGIGMTEYNVYNPQLGQQADPLLKWRRYSDKTIGQQMFEVWPPPASPSTLRFRGIQSLPPLVDGTDVCVIDDTLIILTAAAEYLASAGDKGAQVKQQAAQSRYTRLKGNIDNDGVSQLGGSAPPMQEPANQNLVSNWFPLMAKGS